MSTNAMYAPVDVTPVRPDSDEDSISFIDLLIALGQEKKTIVATGLFATVLALVVSLILPPVYTAKTMVLPPQHQQAVASMAWATVGALAGAADMGGGMVPGIKTAEEIYVALLKSNRVQDALIDRFDLIAYYKAKTRMDARLSLFADMRISADKKSGLLTIEVDHADPVQAAEIANACIEELHRLLGRVAVTEAQQRRFFLENQISVARERLATAESSLRTLQRRNGILSLDAQAQGAVRASVDLRVQIAQREVQLSTLRTFATSENSDVKRVLAELAGLRRQLAQLENGSASLKGLQVNVPEGSETTSASDRTSNAQAGASDAMGQSAGLQSIRAYREVKYQEALLDGLVKQYELARVDEAREGVLLQQVDVAAPPERRSRPKRALIVVVSAIAGLLLGSLLAVVRRAFRVMAENPQQAHRLQALQRAWSLR